MYLEKIEISKFRNIQKEIVYPINGINVFIGNNAQGKTNFLESIYVISNFKGFRGKKLIEVISDGFSKTTISVDVNKNKVKNNIFFEIEKEKRNILINNKRPNNFSDYIGYLDTILFYPDDIFVVKGSPTLRRNLIDRAIFQTNNSYLSIFQDYIRCLKQRNAGLKIKKNLFEIWDEKLADLATSINFFRNEYIERINKILSCVFDDIYHCGEKVEIKYPYRDVNPQEFNKLFKERLHAGRKKEQLYGMTLIGPHREDPQFFLNEQSLALYGSQGQQRSFMLAFKTAQIIDFKEKRGMKPVLLLDDMTSELDENRKDSFFESLLNQAGQVFVTSTDKNLLKHRRFSEARFFEVQSGKIGEYN